MTYADEIAAEYREDPSYHEDESCPRCYRRTASETAPAEYEPCPSCAEAMREDERRDLMQIGSAQQFGGRKS